MPQLRLFAPDDDGHYILASSAAEPSLVIDRKAQGACRIAEPAELNNLIGPANKRAKSIKLDGVVGLLNFPDERSMTSHVYDRATPCGSLLDAFRPYTIKCFALST